MKLPTFAKLLVFGFVLTLAAAGCRKTPVGVTQLPAYGKTGPQFAELPASPAIDDPLKANGLETTSSTGFPVIDPTQREKWLKDREIFKTDMVHFDYDSSVIKAPEKPKVATLAEHLKSNPATA